MLNLLIVATATLASYQTSPQRGRPPPPPEFHDHRYAYSIRPSSQSLTTEWTCDGSPRSSIARIAVRDIGRGYRNRFFEVSLIELQVEGEPVAPSIFEPIANALRALNTVEVFQGECRMEHEMLRVTGFAHDGDRHTSRTLEFGLTPNLQLVR